MNSDTLYIGLMSGTSVDAVDVALASITLTTFTVEAFYEHPIPKQLQEKIADLCLPGENELDRMGELDQELGNLFAEAVLALLKQLNLDNQSIHAIGSHGQTVRHRPNNSNPFTLQIGNPSTIAFKTGITTVADFRAKDMAAGGQGAPLVPAFHQNIFSCERIARVVLNIGGIANISRLAYNNKPLIGFDTGPGNTLMDYWCQQHLGSKFDDEGDWARSGNLNIKLMAEMLSYSYFAQTAPKSTGREEFSPRWLNQQLSKFGKLPAVDIQRTLCELTARSISNAITRYAIADSEVLICGGGGKNTFLIKRISALLPNNLIRNTSELGIESDAVEASAFAWLAHRTLNKLPGNSASVTGAKDDVVLGGVYPAT